MPKDKDPILPDGNTSQLLLVDLLSVTLGLPLLAERVEDLFAAVPFCITEKESDVGENESVFGPPAKTGVDASQKRKTAKQNFNLHLSKMFFIKKEE